MTLDPRFANVPVDEDTRLLQTRAERLGDYPACHQQWSWDGLLGESLILVADDVAHLSEAELVDLLRATSLLTTPDSQVTYSNSDSGLVFLNFNFRH